MSTKRCIVAMLFVASNLFAANLQAEEEMTFLYETEILETTELQEGVVAVRFAQRGFVVFKDTSHKLHLASQDCYGSQVTMGENQSAASGHCTTVPMGGGGGYWSAWEGDQDGGTWHIMKSAGNLEGLSATGTWGAPTGQWPGGKAFNTIRGDFKLP